MKKLVKTAKQCFEERLNQLKVVKEEKSFDCLYYLCEDADNHCIILERCEGVHSMYCEIAFSETILDACTDEEFLGNLVDHWIQYIHAPIKDLFEWYASADKDEPPFTIQHLAQLSMNASCISFDDIYEEIPDVRIVTAKEQWEKDSKYAKVLVSSKDITLKVCVTDESVIFYRSDDIFSRATYPSLNEMRQDAMFVGHITEDLNEASMSDDIAIFLRWVHIGGDFPIPLSAIYHSEYQNYKYKEYEDKEEQPIEKKDFLSEIYELRDKMVEHIKDLCEQGMTIDLDKLLKCTFLLWDDMSHIRPEELPDFWLAKNKFGVWMAYRSGDGGCEYELYDFSIETLQHIINCLH